jgi:hypothetical protein
MSSGFVSDPPEDDVFPLPLGIDENGEFLPALTSSDLVLASPDLETVRGRAETQKHGMGLAIPEVAPNNLEQAGWGIVFAPAVGQDIKDQLAGLIERRKQQAGGPFEAGGRFRCFQGDESPQTAETVRDWLERHNVTFAAVDPSDGVPLYLLLVGDQGKAGAGSRCSALIACTASCNSRRLSIPCLVTWH